MTSPLEQPDFTQNSGTTYKTNLDNAIAVFLRMAGAFSPQAQDTPDMTVKVNAGHVFDGSTLTEVAAQSTGSITAPASDDRIDRVVISATDGSVSVITGSEGASPSAPSITAGNLPCAQVYLTPSTTEIANSDITDERSGLPDGSPPQYESGRIELGGDFDAGEEVVYVRSGNIVTVTADRLSHSSGDGAESTFTLPADLRPDDEQNSVYHMDSTGFCVVSILATGDVVTEYRDFSGTLTSRSNTGAGFSVSYAIDVP